MGIIGENIMKLKRINLVPLCLYVFILISSLIIPPSAFSEGSCTEALVLNSNGGSLSYVLTLTCTSDSSAGTVAYTMSDDTIAAVKNFFNIEDIVTPVTGTISDGFDVYLYTETGIAAASSTSCSQTAKTELTTSSYRLVTGKWTMAAANCGNSKVFTLISKFCCAK